MRKIFLLAATMLLSLNLMATLDYKLEVAGTAVTDANEDDVLGDGTVWYDDGTHALTLSNAHLTGDIWYHPSWADDSEFTINVVGKCSIALNGSNTAGAIYIQAAHVNIIGYGAGAELEISHLNGTGTGAAIEAYGNYKERELNVNGVKLTAISDSNHGIECATLNVAAGTTIDAMGADDKRGIECSLSDINLTETEIVYSTKNSTTLAACHHVIIIPESEVQLFDGLLVDGVQLNQYTVKDVFENEVEDTWDDANKVLTLKGENYTGNEDQVLFDFTVPATLKFQGKDKFFNSTGTPQNPLIQTTSDLTITGAANVQINTGYDHAISLLPSTSLTLTFDKADVEITAANYSIRNNNIAKTANLAFIGSHVELVSNVKDINSDSFEGCAIEDGLMLGEGAYVDPMMCMPDCSPASMVRINATAYPVSVKGNGIYPYNASDVMGDGKISYDHSTKTLTVKEDADLEGGTTTPVIEVDGQDLTIIFKGIPAAFFAGDNEAIKMANGTGHKLTLISQPDVHNIHNASIHITSNNNNDLPIINAAGADVEFRGGLPFAVFVDKGSAVKWYVNAPLIKANKLYVNAPLGINTENTTTEHDVLDVTSIELSENMELDPLLTDLQFNSGTKQVEWKVSSSNKIRQVAFAAKALESTTLTIAGIKVTKANAADVLGNGKVSYDEANAKLTLDNATIFSSADAGIYALVVPGGKLTVEVKGKSVISCENLNAIAAFVDLEFVGSGSNPYLKVATDAHDNAYYAMYVAGSNVTFKDLTAVVSAYDCPANAIYIAMSPGTLTVDNADLRVFLEESPGGTDAIGGCTILDTKNGSALRYDEPEWPMVTWTDGVGFGGSDLTRVWIGKNIDFPTSVENIALPAEKAIKVLRDGQLLIIRGDKVYSITGALIQ